MIKLSYHVSYGFTLSDTFRHIYIGAYELKPILPCFAHCRLVGINPTDVYNNYERGEPGGRLFRG